MLTHYAWPVSIREMRNVLKRAARSTATRDEGPGNSVPGCTLAAALDTNLTMRELELRCIGQVLAIGSGLIKLA